MSVVHSTREPDLSAAHVAGRHRVTRMTCEAKASADCGHGIRQTCKCIGAGDPTRCDPPPDRAAAATQITRQPPSRRGPPSHRRGQRDVARRISAPRAGIIRALSLPRRRPCPATAGSCRAPPAARRQSENPPRCSRTRPRTPQPAHAAASVLLARPSRHHSWRIAGHRAGRHYAATSGKFPIRSPATVCVAVGATAAPARAPPSRWVNRPLGRQLERL